jgi:hypothetical protein
MTAPKPQAAIRRFDVFAEYNRQKARAEGMPAAQAKGHGLWLAKWVASRKFRKSSGADDDQGKSDGAQPARKRASKWKSLSGEPQTDKLFDREIVARMGTNFYRRVFVPAIERARERGQSYEAIRDSIRREWKP